MLDEITVGDTEMADRRIAILRGVQMLPADPAIAGLADEDTQLLGLPPKAYNDGVHLAYGTLFGTMHLTKYGKMGKIGARWQRGY